MLLAAAAWDVRSESCVADVSPIYQLDFAMLIIGMGVIARMIKEIWRTADLCFRSRRLWDVTVMQATQLDRNCSSSHYLDLYTFGFCFKNSNYDIMVSYTARHGPSRTYVHLQNKHLKACRE